MKNANRPVLLVKDVPIMKRLRCVLIAISNEVAEMVRENMVHLVYIHLVAKRCIEEIIEYAEQKN